MMLRAAGNPKPVWWIVTAIAVLAISTWWAPSALAHITGCYSAVACCPQDDPTGCSDQGTRLRKETVCVTCQLSYAGFQACFYECWYWDYNGDGVTDCVETCYRGKAWGPCP